MIRGRTEMGCLCRLTYSLPAPGHAFAQEDTGLPKYVAHRNVVLSHGHIGVLIRPKIPCLAHILRG